METITLVVLLITIAVVALYAQYHVVRRAVRDEMAAASRTAPRRADESPS